MTDERCDECGFDYDALPRDRLVPALTAGAAETAATLRDTPAARLRRRQPPTWSPLEYGCHLRDVLDVQRGRILLAQREDLPAFVPMGRDERATADRYNEQDPSTVADTIERNADALATTLTALDDAGWERKGIYSYPTRRPRTMEWVVRNTLHELTHHLRDIERQLTATDPSR